MTLWASFMFLILPFQNDPVRVPAMTKPTIDNALSEGEWQAASKIPLAEGGYVRIGADAETVYLALGNVPPGRFGFACVFLHLEDRVMVLHASAQLGSAIYREKDGQWYPDHEKYEWKVADRMWREEHWQAGVRPKGTQEFAISRKILGTQPVIALGYWLVENRQERAIPWPDGLDDGTQNLRLLAGFNPGGLQFSPARWVTLSLP